MLFNGTDLSPYLRIKKINGRGFTKRDVWLRMASGSDGASYQKKRRPPRELEVEANVLSSSAEDLQIKLDQLNGILSVDGPVAIVFPDEPLKTYYGAPAMTDGSDEAPFLHKGKITFVCPDPNKYGPELTKAFSNGVLSFFNNGTTETRGKLTITMLVNAPNLTVSNGTESLRLNYTFLTGNTIVIDFKTRKVTINGLVKMTAVALAEPDFFSLKKGQNNITIVPTSTASLVYKEAWE